MNKSLSLVIALTVVIIITVVLTYFDLMDMDRENAAKNLSIPDPALRLTRHNQPHSKAVSKYRIEQWNKEKMAREGRQFIGKAYLFYRNGKLAAAEEAVRTALIFLPQDNNALALLGRILYETGRYDLAEQVFREQVKQRKSATAYNNLGEAMARLGKYQEAIEIFNLAAERQPASATIQLNLAGLHSISGNKNQALQFFRQAFGILGYKVVPVAHDPALDSIRSEPEFKQIIKSAKQLQPR
jgi:tetratricopeptide (TPR) repeat protein